GIRSFHVTGVQTCALPISCLRGQKPGLLRGPGPGAPPRGDGAHAAPVVVRTPRSHGAAVTRPVPPPDVNRPWLRGELWATSVRGDRKSVVQGKSVGAGGAE